MPKLRIFFAFATNVFHNHKKIQTFPFVLSHFSPAREMSQSTSIPKNLERVRDHGFDDYMEIEKKVRKVLKFQDLILSQYNQTIPISRLDVMVRRLGFKQYEAGKFILKFPNVFEIYEHPVQRILYCRLTRQANLQIEQEKQAIIAQIPDGVTRLRKLLMMSRTRRLYLEHVRVARAAFGLPDDFEYSVILKHPQYFRLYNAKETWEKYVALVGEASELGVCAIEKTREKEYREKGIAAEDCRFSFLINFPPGFKITKYFRIAMWKWQRLPYWSPFEDISGYDLRSHEAQKRMEKRAVAMIHELLSLTVEKKITLERIAQFRDVFDLPKKLKDFLLQHQGIFYISTRGNHGKLHTVFLREAYKKGKLIEVNNVYLARRKSAELVGPASFNRAKGEDKVSHMRRDYVGNDIVRDHVDNNYQECSYRDGVGKYMEDEELESDVGSTCDTDLADDEAYEGAGKEEDIRITD